MLKHSVIEPSHTSILFLVNPAAGSGAGLQVSRKIEAILSTDYPEIQKNCTVAFTQPNEILHQVQKACENYATVVAVGGDGTASWILNGIRQNACKIYFGLIPIGTGNDLARSLGLYDPKLSWSEKALRKALKQILHGRPQCIDLFEIEGAGIFSNYMGLGLDAKVLSGYNDLSSSPWFKLVRRSRALKYLCYGILLFKHLKYRLPTGIRLIIQSGDTSKTLAPDRNTQSILVTNTQTYAGGFMVGSGSRIDDGRFEITLIRGIPDILRILLARFAPFRSLTSSLQHEQGDHLSWTAPLEIPYEWDGELSPLSLAPQGSIRLAGQVQVLLPGKPS